MRWLDVSLRSAGSPVGWQAFTACVLKTYRDFYLSRFPCVVARDLLHKDLSGLEREC